MLKRVLRTRRGASFAGRDPYATQLDTRAACPLEFGALLKFDLESETFIGNDRANAMLTREYRAPFVVPKPEEV